jgi:hypothetical protein
MCKNCEKTAQIMWIQPWKACGIFVQKMWVVFCNLLAVGKNHDFYPYRPTVFSPAFLTHRPLLASDNSTLSTGPITITILNKGEKKCR